MSATPDRRTDGDGDAPRPLRTVPRPLVVHWLVDSAVIFLALILEGLFFGVPWWGILIVALVLGAGVARFTRRADERAMAARRDRGGPGQPGVGSP